MAWHPLTPHDPHPADYGARAGLDIEYWQVKRKWMFVCRRPPSILIVDHDHSRIRLTALAIGTYFDLEECTDEVRARINYLSSPDTYSRGKRYI